MAAVDAVRVSRRATALLAAACALVGVANVARGLYIPAKALLAQRLIQRSWTQVEAGRAWAPPWPWADTQPVARMRVPAHGVDLFILAGDSGRTLAFGPGHATESARPGEPGTVLVSGHRDTHFRFLRRVAPGEVVVLETPDRAQHRYRVTRAEVVDSRDALIVHDPDVERLVLVTCYPFDTPVPGGPLRYVVTASPEPDAPVTGLALTRAGIQEHARVQDARRVEFRLRGA